MILYLFIYPAAVWLCFCTGLFALYKGWIKSPTTFRMLTISAMVATYETVGTLFSMKAINNVWIFNLFVPLLMASLLLLFYRQLVKWQNYIPVLLSVGVLIYSLYWTFSRSLFFSVFNTNLLVIGSVCLLIVTLLYFYAVLQRDIPILSEPLFWVATGIMFFFGGTLIHSLMQDYLLSFGNKVAKKMFQVVQILGILFYLTFGFAFVCQKIFRK
ncbi:hypothetical protein QWY31_14210 [Cytophagales bacterium LB-30]|uniref:Transporter n=1 Tax=Shiella aurantiaca TaxID=3058365 RepID=A0ABT8F857_9BACT|nr:hypothetical protein [Shiella aurantiaca]MDN4166660.1 hypothetical protein [Shiella aurantiaca]